MTDERARLQETLGRPELQRLVRRLRARLERGEALRGILSLSDATAAERDAVNRLLGRPPTRGKTLAISLEVLEEKLRTAGISSSLQKAVEDISGAVVNRRAEREAAEIRWRDLFASAITRVAGRPELDGWLTQLRATGLLRRHGISSAQTLLAQTLSVFDALPAQDMTLAELAATVLGDAHALDPDTSLGTIIIRAVAALGKCERWDGAQARREAWASVGVICDELSAPVLVLNLRAADDSPTSRAMRAYADAGEPSFLSIRQLLRAPPKFTTESLGPLVYICENPSVVAAVANRLGARSRPLICIEGQPRTATRLLLNRLQACGIRLFYHGDFDWPGIQITNTILARHNAEPWRMSANDYRVAATRALRLSGLPVQANWDAELMPVMREVGRAVHEEQLMESLAADLAQGDRG